MSRGTGDGKGNARASRKREDPGEEGRTILSIAATQKSKLPLNLGCRPEKISCKNLSYLKLKAQKLRLHALNQAKVKVQMLHCSY